MWDTCVTPKQKVDRYRHFFHGYASFELDTIFLIWSCHTGIWIWGTPIDMEIDGVKTSVFYIDTEGFESIGKSNVYDDR